MVASRNASALLSFAVPGIETLVKTVAATQPGSALLSFAPFPTAMDFGAGKTDTYVNKVAPTARIYLHLICRKRHLPLKLRKGKTMGCRQSFALI